MSRSIKSHNKKHVTLQDGGQTSSSSSASKSACSTWGPTIPADTRLAPAAPSVLGSLATRGVRGRCSPPAPFLRRWWCLCLCECDLANTYLRKSITKSVKLPATTNALLAKYAALWPNSLSRKPLKARPRYRWHTTEQPPRDKR